MPVLKVWLLLEYLLEMQIFGPHPGPAKLETLVGPSKQALQVILMQKKLRTTGVCTTANTLPSLN